MIDHVLGRPSIKFRKVQVFAVVAFWSLYLVEGNRNGPPILRRLSKRLSTQLTPWRTLVLTLLWLYISRNFAKICGLESPEPLANLYSRSFFRATWITTALDAGFWTAMRIKSKWLRDFASIIFSVYYLIAAEQADEKVRKVRGALTVDHLRVSWNKSTTPYLALFGRLTRPKFTRYSPKKIRIPRPPQSSYKEPITAWLYYDGPFSTIDRHSKVVLDLPGGGFVAMGPRANDDKLFAWSGRTGLPILSLDYKKAPEHPYPYALNECYDAYHTIMASRGRCIGFTGERQPQIIVTGDSAGGNLATGMVLMIIQNSKMNSQRRLGEESLPIPDGLILLYPALDMNINSWITDEQMSLIQDQRSKAGNRNFLRKKSQDYYSLDPSTPAPSDDEEERSFPFPTPGLKASSSSAIITQDDDGSLTPTSPYPPTLDRSARASLVSEQQGVVALSKPRILKTRLAMSSMISYFNDRIITPEMMRAMVILYVGPHTRPDFTTDYLLSPLLAPEILLASFPKTYFLTGERDPLVDDTVIFAGRLRQAKYNLFVQRKELGIAGPRERFNEREHVEVSLIPGISHGFIQFVGAFPEGWRYILRCARWIEEIFGLDMLAATPLTPTITRDAADTILVSDVQPQSRDSTPSLEIPTPRRHHTRSGTSSSAEDDRPLEMTALSSSNKSINGTSNRNNSKTRAARAKTDAEKLVNARQKKETLYRGRQKEGSLIGTKSEDDLLKRRMKGFAEGLMGMSEE